MSGTGIGVLERFHQDVLGGIVERARPEVPEASFLGLAGLREVA